VLRRRLAWLVAFGALHGALIWYGDVLLIYALAGLVMAACRSWPAARLATTGLVLAAVSILMNMTAEFAIRPSPDAVEGFFRAERAAVVNDILAFGGGLWGAVGANLQQWAVLTPPVLVFYGPLTLGLMMLGLALFRTGVLTGAARGRLYAGLLAAGLVALVVLGASAAWQISKDFPAQTRPWVFLLEATLAPVVTLSYVAAIALALRSSRWSLIGRLLAPVGRMAFTNYIAQSLIMTGVFYGRGLGLHGGLDWPEWTLLVVNVWLLQIALSHWWLSRFSMGPLEWGWRRLSYGRSVRLRLPRSFEGGAVPGR
jgi:uncharacterized protein